MELNSRTKQVAQKTTKSDEATTRLRQAIMTGEIAPGEWLRQEDLALRLGISPTPVRESLRRLESEGLVEHMPHQGVRVVAYTVNDVREYYDLRMMLEPYLVRLVGAKLTPADLQELDALIDKAKRYLAEEAVAELTLANWEFHDWLLSRCESRLVQDVMTRIRRSFQLDTLLMIPERASSTVLEHESLVNALRHGEIEQAAAEMQKNIANAKQAMLTRLPKLAIASNPHPHPLS